MNRTFVGTLLLVSGAVVAAACSSADTPSADRTQDGGAPDPGGADGGGTPSGDDVVPAEPAPSGPAPQPDSVTTPCWPYDRPALGTLRASKKKVYAHYFSAYPLSLDNQPAASDYYARHYLNPDGEGGKFYDGGGLIAERPVPQTPRAGSDWLEQNMATEVRRAAAIGLDGFTYDLLSSSGAHWNRLIALLKAIPKADPDFKVFLVIDMNTSSFGSGTVGTDDAVRTAIVDVVKQVHADPSLLHLPDGRLLLSAFQSGKRSASFWKTTLDQLADQDIPTAFVPMPVSNWEGESQALKAAGVPIVATTTWGGRTVNGAAGQKTNIGKAHALDLLWMAPVAPQDSRPKDLTYVEASNSGAFRALWEATISGGADWVQMITWSDYSEHSEMSPSSKTNNAFYDLTGYYTTWFKTGVQPAIARDALYYFHRANNIDPAVAPPAKGKAYRAVNGPAGENFIEVVGFLTAPGTLEITVNGETRTSEVQAGIQSFRVPLAAGTPVFRLKRGGNVVVELTSASTVRASIDFVDPLYHAGTSLTCDLAP